MTADDLMRLVSRYTEACDDLGAGLFNQTEAETNAKHAKAKALHGQILAEVYRLHAVAAKSERHVTIEDAHAMGASGTEGAGIEHSEPERLAFEAWMRGHRWSYSDTWNGAAYDNREGYEPRGYDPVAEETRRLWAAWRDRAALTSGPHISLDTANSSANIHDMDRVIHQQESTMSETIHPIVAELHGLTAAIDNDEFGSQPALGAAWDAYLESDETDEAPGPLRAAYDAARMAAIARRDALMQHVVREDLPREWRLIEDGQYYGTFVGTSAEAEAEAEANVDRDCYTEYASSTMWIDWEVRCDLTGESESGTVTLEPIEPECVDGHTHEWTDGGDEFGGARGHGGGIIVSEICRHCGTYRVTDTWAQRMDTGEQGLTSVSYSDADDDSLEYIQSLRDE